MLHWEKFLKIKLVAFAGLLGLLLLFVICLNPYGNLPVSAVSSHVIMDDNQRFQYPSVIRSGRYDSIIIGTSTSRLLDPVMFEKHLGGHFANLAMNSARAWEQYRVADLFLRKTPNVKTLLVGLDHVWCWEDADTARITRRGFPEWMYDDNPWNDFLYMLNPKAVEIAFRQVSYYLGINGARLPTNGYRVFTPPEESYDLAKARPNIWLGRPREIKPVDPPYVPNARDLEAWRYPALAWLDEIVSRVKKPGRAVLVFTPPHFSYLPTPGSREAARFALCKRRIVEIAERHGAHLIDFRIRSPITRDEKNYWDFGHYRVPIAARIVRGIARALETGRDDPGGDWRYLTGPGMPHQAGDVARKPG